MMQEHLDTPREGWLRRGDVMSAAIRGLVTLAIGCLIAGTTQAAAPAAFKLQGDNWTCEVGGESVSGILLKPEGKGPFPALLISHGKGGSVRGFTQQKATQFVKEGFVCIGCNYTHAGEPGQRPGPGPAGRPGRGRTSPDDGASAKNIARAVACLDILGSLPDVDPERVFAYGHSMGGFVTIGLAIEHPERLKAAIISGSGLAPQDGYPAPSREKAKSIKTPFLMLHGDADTVVRPDQSLALKEVLDKQSIVNERHVFEGAGHNIDRDRPDEAFTLAKAWLKRHGAYEGAKASR
jgi:dipeptidyl aminopeptidase/acylaminoacyl peptidase